ncbi:unnamed protein product, partial [Heterosigma akashiwo]
MTSFQSSLTGTPPKWASAACASPAARNSGWRWRGRWRWTPPCCCWTRPPPPSTP